MVVTACMMGSSESWGLNSTHIHGTHVPVEEPQKWIFGLHVHAQLRNWYLLSRMAEARRVADAMSGGEGLLQ
jgi:hypothetical protein